MTEGVKEMKNCQAPESGEITVELIKYVVGVYGLLKILDMSLIGAFIN